MRGSLCQHPVMEPTGALAPYRVLDLTDGRASLAAFVLAGLGADVVRVEPSSRGVGEAPPGAVDELRNHAFNRGKRSVVLDLDSPQGRTQLLELAATADFVFENADPGAMTARGLGFDALRAVRPDLVYVAITPFGQTGPYSHHVATDLTLSAMGGAMALNGEPDRRPVRITVPQTWYHGAVEGALGALVAHERRLRTGEPQFVDVSVQAAVFWTGLQAMIAHSIMGRDIERNGTVLQLSTMTAELVFPCADGEVVLIATTGTLVGVIPWMVEAGVVTPEWAAAEDWRTYEARMLTAASLAYSVDEVRAEIRRFTMAHTKAELFAGGLERNINIAPVNTAADVVAFDHLTVRNYWDTVELSDRRTVRAAGPFVKASATPVRWARPAPRRGEHTDEVLASLAGQTASRRTSSRSPGTPASGLPLEGVKVADFSWIGVGPITAKALADNGATVIRIESDNPADRLRLVGPFKDDIAGINRCQFFGSFNTSKMSLQLNLKNPDGHAIARRMLAWCDIALDSFTAGTMNEIGLGYDVARSLNPGIIMASTCLFGQTGPARSLPGYGYHAAAASGFYEVTGWDDRPPAGPFNAYTDTIAPRFLASTLLAALDHRRRTGEGQYIDQAQMESALHFLSPELLGVQLSGRSPRRSGNFAPGVAPHDAYPCAGHDEWCAIAVETDAQWQALRHVLGDPDWARDPALDTAEGRCERTELIDRHLGSFTSQHEPRALMNMLQAAGVPAGMVQRSSDHQEDPQLAHRGFFRPLEHPEMGLVPYEGHPYQILGYANGPRFAAPCLGEHTFEVLNEILGMSVDEVADAMANGACG